MRTPRNHYPTPLGTRGADFAAGSQSRHGRETPAEAPPGLRLRTFASRRAIDRQIVSGCACDTCPELVLRAHQLTDPRARREIARSIRGAVEYATRETRPSLISAVMVERSAVKYGRSALLDLADQLEMAQRVTPRGVLLAKRLLCDGLSPLYNPRAEQTLAEGVREIQDALAVASPVEALAA